MPSSYINGKGEPTTTLYNNCETPTKKLSPPKNIKKIKIKSPYCCKNIFAFSAPNGKNLKRIQEPSSGGIGTKLNIAHKKLYIVIIPSSSIKGTEAGRLIILINNPKNIAIAKFVAGPEIATFKLPHFWSLKLYGFTGTGFAQPKIGPCPPVANNNKSGTITEPNGSKCFNGFSVSLPAYLAVGSPKE